jgi:hypothetical protein
LSELEASIVNIFLTAAFSAIIAYLTSEIAVERSRLRRTHTEKLKDSLSEWVKSPYTYIEFRSEYSHNEGKIEAKIARFISTIPFYDYLWSHLKKGHKDITESWNYLYELFLKLNKERANIINNIHIKLKELNIDSIQYFYYPKLYEKQPEEFIMLAKISEMIYEEIKMRLEKKVYWNIGEPRIVKFYGREEILFHSLIMPSPLSHEETCVTFIKYDDVVKTMKNIYNILDDEEINNTIRSFLSQYSEFKKEEINFTNKLKKLIWYIELGNNLKGNCDFCPGQIYKTLKDRLNL